MIKQDLRGEANEEEEQGRLPLFAQPICRQLQVGDRGVIRRAELLEPGKEQSGLGFIGG